MPRLDFCSYPVKTLAGDISVPGDKSISHRSIILAAIAKGSSRITGFLEAEDCKATLTAFRAMGVQVEGPKAGELIIHGLGKYGLKKPNSLIDCGNSGTSLRLLCGLLAAQAFDSELSGDASLQKRPMERVGIPLRQMGADIKTSKGGTPPIQIFGGKELCGIHYDMPEASAQVKSSLLLAGMYARGETRVSSPGICRDHTERMLRSFSYPVDEKGLEVSISNEGECVGTTINVPGDLSSAAFFIVAATIIPGSKVIIRNVGVNPTRTGILTILTAMGAHISLKNERFYGAEPVADLYVEHAPLVGITIAEHLVSLAIDEFPIIFIAAACASGETRLSAASELRRKESDRISAMVSGLTALGIDALAFEDGLRIQGGSFQGGVVDCHHDHRIAMSFAIAGAVAEAPITIKNCTNVATSFPSFVNTATQVNLAVLEVRHDV